MDAHAGASALRGGKIPYLLNRRRNNRRCVLWMPEFQMHPSPHIPQLQHGPSERRSRNRYLHRIRAELRMPRNERVAAAQQHSRITMIQGLDFKNGRRGQIMQKHAAFNFRLNDGAVHVIGKVWVWREHTL
jgi:hypothetical protein